MNLRLFIKKTLDSLSTPLGRGIIYPWIGTFVLGCVLIVLIHPKGVSLISFFYGFFGVNGFDKAMDPSWQIILLFLSIIGCIAMSGIVVWYVSYKLQQAFERRRIAQNEEQLKKLNGTKDYPELKDHIVVIGYSGLTLSIIKEMLRKSEAVALLTSCSIPDVRAEIEANCTSEEKEKIFYFSGNITMENHLRRLNLTSCEQVYILGEGDTNRDTNNLLCAKLINKIVGEQPHLKPLPLHVELDTSTAYATIQRLKLPSSYTKKGDQVISYLRPFNYYENWARMLWGFFALHKYDRLDFEPLRPDSSKYVHLVIVGFDNMGTALLLEALRICHFPNFDEKKKAIKTKITVIDKHMDELLPRFKANYAYLDQITDIDIEYRHADMANAEVRQDISQWAKDPNQLLTIAISFYDSDNSISAALSLPVDCFYQGYKTVKSENGQEVIVPNPTSNVRILVRQQIQSGIADILRENKKYANVRTFGELDVIQSALFDDTLAQWTSFYYHLAHKNSNEENIKFEDCVQEWYQYDESTRFSNRYQIEMYKIYEDYDDNIKIDHEILYQMEHLRWCAERSVMGFKDASKEGCKETSSFMQHRLIIPFYKLLEKDKEGEEKEKDIAVIQNRKKIIQEYNK
ncbi:MAG: hypothetical protein KBS70_04110 [Bacteroidales bacterium]|nr:hypothetical protein [Candidatus Colicola equi]